MEKIGFDSLIPQICKITSSSSFLCCLSHCFKGIIPIYIIATVHESLILAGFLQYCAEWSFVKREKEKSHCAGLHYYLGWFLVKCLNANFNFYPRHKIPIMSMFFGSLCLEEALYQSFIGRCVGLDIPNKSQGGSTRWVKLWLQLFLREKEYYSKMKRNQRGKSTHIASYTPAILAKPPEWGWYKQTEVWVRKRVVHLNFNHCISMLFWPLVKSHGRKIK